MSRTVISMPLPNSRTDTVETVVIHETPPDVPTEPKQTEHATAIFSDGTTFYIKNEWKDKSPLLCCGGVVFQNSELFKKYVIPLLDDEPIPSVDCDELHEISTIIRLSQIFGINVSDKQIINVSDSFNLQSAINDIRSTLQQVKSIWHPQKAKRFETFCSYWDEHVQLLAKVNNNELYAKLTSQEIINTIINLSYLEISKLNFKYSNIIFFFSDYLKKAIKDKNFVDIMDVNLKLNFSVSGGLTSMLSDGVNFASSIIEMIPEKYKNKIKDVVMEKIKNVDLVSSLLK